MDESLLVILLFVMSLSYLRLVDLDNFLLHMAKILGDILRINMIYSGIEDAFMTSWHCLWMEDAFMASSNHLIVEDDFMASLQCLSIEDAFMIEDFEILYRFDEHN